MSFNSREEYEEAIRKSKGNVNVYVINKYGEKVKKTCRGCKFSRFPASGIVCIKKNKPIIDTDLICEYWEEH